MESYKKFPFKKRQIFYENIIDMAQPLDLSFKCKIENKNLINDPVQEKHNFYINLSTNSFYDKIRHNTNELINRSESPKSIISESSYQDLTISTNNQDYENIHLRGFKPTNNYINYLPTQYCWPTTNYSISTSSSHPEYNYQQYSDFSYNLTPPSSPLSTLSSEPEDLSVKNTSPTTLYHHLQQQQQQQQQQHFQPNLPISPTKRTRIISKPKELNRFKCEKCSKSYSTSTGLSKHQHFHCPSAECNQIKKDFSCQNCDKVYTTLGALKMHIRTHTLPCKCPICGKAFSRPWLLQGHIRTHTGEKPFSCQHCNRAFADRSNLRAHQQTHVEVKKYICENCQKSFSRMSLLAKHISGGCGSGGAGVGFL